MICPLPQPFPMRNGWASRINNVSSDRWNVGFQICSWYRSSNRLKNSIKVDTIVLKRKFRSLGHIPITLFNLIGLCHHGPFCAEFTYPDQVATLFRNAGFLNSQCSAHILVEWRHEHGIQTQCIRAVADNLVWVITLPGFRHPTLSTPVCPG
jgi:hypothetical protein